jgi:hypothetical protein
MQQKGRLVYMTSYADWFYIIGAGDWFYFIGAGSCKERNSDVDGLPV